MSVLQYHWNSICRHHNDMRQKECVFLCMYVTYVFIKLLASVLWRCWLGGRKGIRPVKNWVVGSWHGYLSKWNADLHMAQLMPLSLTVSCFSKIQTGFTFLVPAHPGSLGKRAVKRVCVCVCISTGYNSRRCHRSRSDGVPHPVGCSTSSTCRHPNCQPRTPCPRHAPTISSVHHSQMSASKVNRNSRQSSMA